MIAFFQWHATYIWLKLSFTSILIILKLYLTNATTNIIFIDENTFFLVNKAGIHKPEIVCNKRVRGSLTGNFFYK
jgi:hypothetical protein